MNFFILIFQTFFPNRFSYNIVCNDSVLFGDADCFILSNVFCHNSLTILFCNLLFTRCFALFPFQMIHFITFGFYREGRSNLKVLEYVKTSGLEQKLPKSLCTLRRNSV